MKTKIVYKNINIFTVCRPFTSNRGTVKSTYTLLSKQWQRRIKNTSCDSILPYFPGNEHFCWLFFFLYTSCANAVRNLWVPFLNSWRNVRFEKLYTYFHIYIHIYTSLIYFRLQQPWKRSVFHEETFPINTSSHQMHLEEWQEEWRRELGKCSSYFSTVFRDGARRYPNSSLLSEIFPYKCPNHQSKSYLNRGMSWKGWVFHFIFLMSLHTVLVLITVGNIFPVY